MIIAEQRSRDVFGIHVSLEFNRCSRNLVCKGTRPGFEMDFDHRPNYTTSLILLHQAIAGPLLVKELLPEHTDRPDSAPDFQ
jgi:hypothetical protein